LGSNPNESSNKFIKMDKSDIKRLMIVHNDNDFIRAWDWLGKVTLSTLVETNYCGESPIK
jgi:hypothetical protein